MELVVALLLAIAVAWLVRGLGIAVNRVAVGLGTLFVGWRPDPWPRGVQEEDRDRPWGRAEAPPPRLTAVTAVRARPSVRFR